MAGYSKIYCIDGTSTFLGPDGINPIQLQIWVGDSSRQWLEPRYFDGSIRPLGSIGVIIPEGPDDPNALLDACIAFFPRHFESCPTLTEVALDLAGVKRLDFHTDGLPNRWRQLRKEAWPYFRKLIICEGRLVPVDIMDEPPVMA
jgi:hypothetical protein